MTGMLLNLILATGKFMAGKLSGSVSITADAMNNLVDAGTVLLSIIGMKIAANRPGRNHPDGHGKLEWVISLITGMLIVQTGVEVLKGAVSAVLHPANTVFSPLSVAVLLSSIGVKLALWAWFNQKGKKENSISCQSISLDSLCDAASTAAVLAALLLNHFLGWRVDGWLGLAMALLILYNGMKIIMECAGRLMGKAAPEQAVSMLKATIQSACPEEVRIYEAQIEDCGYGHHKASVCISPLPGESCARLVECVPVISAILKEKLGYDAVIQVEETVDTREEKQLYAAVSGTLNRTGVTCRIEEFRVDRMSDGCRQIRMVLSVSHREESAVEMLEALLNHSNEMGLPENVFVFAKIRMDRQLTESDETVACEPMAF